MRRREHNHLRQWAGSSKPVGERLARRALALSPAHASVERMESNCLIYRRRLPHVRQTFGTYFVTFRLAQHQPDLSHDERSAVMASLHHFDGTRYHLFALVVMNDHVHVILRPASEYRLEQIVHSWKSFTAHRLTRGTGRRPPLWQDEYWDRVLRDDQELRQKAEYILGNPQKRWPECVDYRWVWAVGLPINAAGETPAPLT
jgi:REP element-mobilizing transposase RayT